MLRQWLIVAVCVLYSILPVYQCRSCEDMKVMNFVSDFDKLKGCTVIVGSLRILLMEKTTTASYTNVSFPELKEITGFLLVYRVKGLTSLGQLFPNLSVIRGQTLIADFSFVLYEVTDLREIGLYNLRNITRGSTRIERCRKLCYVSTIDWYRIGGPKHKLVAYDMMDQEECSTCPKHCNGLCWNQNYCQLTETEDCDSECFGCTGPTANECYACRSKKDNQRCVSRCPENKFAHSLTGQCITKDECLSSTLFNETWRLVNGECSNLCVENCIKECKIDSITNAADVQRTQGCTHIKGSLEIKIDSKSTAEELEKHLGKIQEIEGYLKIYRSHPLTSLEFFKSLRVIHGKTLDNKRHALVVFENQNLQKLWNWNNFTLDIRRGSLSFHFNHQLCLSEIEKLANVTGLKYGSIDVSPFSNGDKTACNYIDLGVAIVRLTSTSVTLEWEKFTMPANDNSTFIGYLLYYIEDPMGNLTIYDERDECDEGGWNSIITSSNAQHVVNLKPYTQYAYYVKTYTSSPLLGGQTEIKRFHTLSDDPSVPLFAKVVETKSDSVTLSWKPPEHPNGVISYYDIITYYEADDSKLLLDRDYCNFPEVVSSKRTRPLLTSDVPFTSTTSNETCCTKKQITSPETFFYNLCDDLQEFSIFSSSSKRCKDYMSLTKNSTLPTEYNGLHLKQITTKETKLVIKPLRHYTKYVFLLKACNTDGEIIQCSPSIMINERTSKQESADDIPSEIKIDVTKDEAFISWNEPNDPNSLIVSYHVQHTRIDIQHSHILTECVTSQKYARNGYGYPLKRFPPGKYLVKVKAFSLAGGGRFSEPKEFEISAPASNITIIVAIVVPVVIVIILIITIGAFTYYYYYKKKHRFDHLHLITNVNPDYAGPIYVEDEWEMDRDDLIVSKELGQGTFGMVYSGFIKSKNRPCAVKTVNETSNVYEKMVFLNEASVMKSFSDAHHVVKLLAVVSKGDPPFVVMELMARGDLKSFLRRSRDSSTTITCAEMYRMAAEIADGMMYLSAKKFVHRDLAARNCMVAADYTVKIGDFGMTRDIYETDYYRKESRGLMPVRWMSPESLADGVFTTDSDVWSYGVVLWEMATLAEQPYQGLANEQVLDFIIAQGTLERPAECPDLLYDIMEVCWKWRPNSRPRFEDIVEKFEPNIGQNFRLVSFYHSAAGEEFRMNARTRVYNPPALAVPLDKSKRIHWKTSQDDLSLYSSYESNNRPTPLLSSLQHQSRNNSLSDDDNYR